MSLLFPAITVLLIAAAFLLVVQLCSAIARRIVGWRRDSESGAADAVRLSQRHTPIANH